MQGSPCCCSPARLPGYSSVLGSINIQGKLSGEQSPEGVSAVIKRVPYYLLTLLTMSISTAPATRIVPVT